MPYTITVNMLASACADTSASQFLSESTALILAAYDNDVKTIKALMALGCDVNHVNKLGAAIPIAAARGSLEAVRELLKHNPTPVVDRRKARMTVWPVHVYQNLLVDMEKANIIVDTLNEYAKKHTSAVNMQRKWRAMVAGNRVRKIIQKGNSNAIALIMGSVQTDRWQNNAHFALGELADKLFPKQWQLVYGCI